MAFFFIIQKICDLTHLGVHTGGCYDSGCGAIGNRAAGKYHVGTVAQGCVFIDDNGCVLFRGHGFTGQSRLFGLEADAAQKSCISRNKVTGFQTDDITGNQFGGIDDFFFSIPNHPGMGRGHTFQGIQSFFRLALLHDAHHGVEHHDQQDQYRLKKLLGILLHASNHKGDDSCDQQNDDHGILKLVKEPLDIGFLFLFPELIGSVKRFLGFDLLGGQSIGHVGLEL